MMPRAGSCEICGAMQRRELNELRMLRWSSEDLKREAKRKLRPAPPKPRRWEDLKRELRHLMPKPPTPPMPAEASALLPGGLYAPPVWWW